MENILIEVTRGPLVENVIRGSLAVVDRYGQIIAHFGDPLQVAYMRSAAKPLQASAAVECGALDSFGIGESELAVMCGSHIGEEYHAAAVESILAKLALSEAALTLGAELSMNKALREQRLAAGASPRKIYNNCSGKHACMLALCRHLGWEIAAYQQPEHPAQRLIRATVAAYCAMEPEELVVGTDGCGVPVFALPLAQMAVAYRNLANAERHLPEQRARAARRITAAMGAHPEMVAGDGQFCTELMRATQGRVIGKMGAGGIYCSAPLQGGLGVALKIEDGNGAALPLVMMSALAQLDLLSRGERERLARFRVADNINCQGDKVGETRAVFRLLR